MLEKELGVTLVTKFQAIRPMEADYNTANKIIYGNRMLQLVQNHRLVPEEIFNKRGKTPVDGILSKILFYDISRQL